MIFHSTSAHRDIDASSPTLLAVEIELLGRRIRIRAQCTGGSSIYIKKVTLGADIRRREREPGARNQPIYAASTRYIIRQGLCHLSPWLTSNNSRRTRREAQPSPFVRAAITNPSPCCRRDLPLTQKNAPNWEGWCLKIQIKPSARRVHT